MNQNTLLINGSSSIIDSIPLSGSKPFSQSLSSNKDYSSVFQQSPSTQHTFTSVDGNSNSKSNNSLSSNLTGQLDNNSYRITGQLFDSIQPPVYSSTSSFTTLSQQIPSVTGKQSFNYSITPILINSVLSMNNGNFRSRISNIGDSPHKKVDQKFNKLVLLLKYQNSIQFSSIDNINASLNSFFQTLGYSLSTATSPSSNPIYQPGKLQHQSSFQGTTNSYSPPKTPSGITSNYLQNEYTNKYSKEGSPSYFTNTTNYLQPSYQQNSSPYSINLVSSPQQKTIEQQQNDNQKIQQQYGIESSQLNKGNPYSMGINNMNILQTPKRDTLQINGMSQSMLEQNNGMRNSLAVNQDVKLFHQSSVGQIEDKQKEKNSKIADDIMSRYYQTKGIQPNSQYQQNIPSQLNNSGINKEQGSFFSQQNNEYQNINQSLPSSLSGQPAISSSYQATPSSSFIQNSSLQYQLPNLSSKPYFNDSPANQQTPKYDNFLLPIGSTPIRKESAPVNETHTLGSLLKNNNDSNQNLNTTPPSGRYNFQKYQSLDQNSIQRALNGYPNSTSTTLQTAASPQTPSGINQLSSPLAAVNQTPGSYKVTSTPVATSGYQNKQSLDDIPFISQSPYAGNQVISIQKPFIGSQSNLQTTSLTNLGGLNSNRQSESENFLGIRDSLLQSNQSNSGTQKSSNLTPQINNLSNQTKNLLNQNDQITKLQQANKQDSLQKDPYQLQATVIQGDIANPLKNKSTISSPQLHGNLGSKQELIIEPLQPQSARTTPYLQNHIVPSPQKNQIVNQQVTYKMTPQQSNQVSQVQQVQGQSQSPLQTNGFNPKTQQQPQQQQQIAQNNKIQQVQGKNIYQSGQSLQQLGSRTRGSFTVVDSSSHPFLTYKNPKQSNNYKQKIWQNILNQRKNKQSSFHSPNGEKTFFGNNLNSSVDDFTRLGCPQQFSPAKKSNSVIHSNGQPPLQIAYNQYGQPINNIANNKPGKTNSEQQIQYITYVNQNGQKVEQKVIAKNPGIPNSAFGDQKDQKHLEINGKRTHDDNPPKINLEIVNSHSTPAENMFYCDQKAMTFSKVSGGSQNSGQNSPAFSNNQQKPLSPSSKKTPQSQFSYVHEQTNQNKDKRNSKYDQLDSIIGEDFSAKTPKCEPKLNGAVKETLNRAMRMSFGGDE